MRHVDEREGGSISATYCLKVHRALIRLILLGNSAVAETVSLSLLTLLKIPARKRIWHWVSLLWVLKWVKSVPSVGVGVCVVRVVEWYLWMVFPLVVLSVG